MHGLLHFQRDITEEKVPTSSVQEKPVRQPMIQPMIQLPEPKVMRPIPEAPPKVESKAQPQVNNPLHR